MEPRELVLVCERKRRQGGSQGLHAERTELILSEMKRSLKKEGECGGESTSEPQLREF